jgi:hypothetical protein
MKRTLNDSVLLRENLCQVIAAAAATSRHLEFGEAPKPMDFGDAQGCQMVCFQTKNSNWVNFGGHYIGKCYILIFYDHLVHFVFIW